MPSTATAHPHHHFPSRAGVRLGVTEFLELSKESLKAWQNDYAASMGAALSYYTLFSLAPLLVIVIALSGLVFGREAVSGQIYHELGGLLGPDGAATIQGIVAKSMTSTGKGVLATVIGVGTLLLGATTVFGELQTDLDRIWRAPPPKEKGAWAFLRARVLSFSMILGIGFLLLVSLVLSAALAAIGKFWTGWLAQFAVVMQAVNFVVSFAIITGLFAMMYKILPRVQLAWRDVWIGSMVTSLLFSLGKLGIGLYLGKSGVSSTYGAAGSVVVLLLWVYYAAQIFLLGAEFTAVYAKRHGSLRQQPQAPGGRTVPQRGATAR